MGAVSRKPKAPEQEISALVRGGGSVADVSPVFSHTRMETRTINLRLPEDVLVEIDAFVQQRRVRVSRNTWILEAIAEKSQREQNAHV